MRIRMKDKIGICNWAFPALQNPECCTMLSKSGITGLQLELGPRDAKEQPLCNPAVRRRWCEAAADCDITLLSLMLTGLMTHSLTGKKGADSLSAALEMLAQGVDAAHSLGLYKLCLPSFGASTVEDESDLHATASFLREAISRARLRGITVVTENVLGPREMECLETKVSGCALYIDAGNYRFFRDVSLLPQLEALLNRSIDEIHMKDGQAGRPGSCLLGEGDAEINACLAELIKLDYRGWLVLENYYSHPSFLAVHKDPFSLLQRDVAYLRDHFFNRGDTGNMTCE